MRECHRTLWGLPVKKKLTVGGQLSIYRAAVMRTLFSHSDCDRGRATLCGHEMVLDICFRLSSLERFIVYYCVLVINTVDVGLVKRLLYLDHVVTIRAKRS